jgi:hypothetical protein
MINQVMVSTVEHIRGHWWDKYYVTITQVMVATVEHIRGHYISLMTTDMFYGRHHDLVNRFIIYILLMTTNMFYGRHHDLGNRYIIYIVISEIDIM